MLYTLYKVVSSLGLGKYNAQTIKPALISGLLLASSVCGAEVTESNNNAFKKGTQAFKQKQYPAALMHLLSAEKKTPERNALLYNIAVTYYKLNSFRQAENYFLRLINNNKYKQLASYNLGRIAIRLGEKEQAKKYFKIATKGRHKKLINLAKVQLKKLKTKSPRTISFEGAIQLAVGNDNNVLLTPDDSPSQTSDQYSDFLVYADIALPAEITLSVNYNVQDYQTINSADYEQIGLSISRVYKTSAWRFTPLLSTTKTELDSVDYLTLNELKFSASTRWTKSSKLLLRYRYSDIQSKLSRFDYLNGDRHQFRIDYKTNHQAGKLRYRYQFEINDRQNTTAKSYSPTRHTLRFRLKNKIIDNWSYSAELGYRRSEYSSVENVRRIDNRMRLRFGTEYKFSKTFRIKAKFTYTDNYSNVDNEKYNRQVYELALGYYF